MKQNKPSFIIAQDVKSGYNNIRWKDVLNNCKRNLIPKLQIQGQHNEETNIRLYREGTYQLLKHVITQPKLKIWKDEPVISLAKGLQ